MSPDKKDKIYKFLKTLNNDVPDGYEIKIAQTKKNIPLTLFKTIKISQEIDYKPHGIWTSGLFDNNENSWSDWVYENDFLDWIDPKKCTYYAIKITKDPNLILKLNTIKKVKDFHKKYGTASKNSIKINWKKVQDDGFYGINFSKYFKSFKNDIDYSWYNSLDATSQCIWNGKAIDDVIKINTKN